MKWHYKTDPDFKWPECGQSVLLLDNEGKIQFKTFYQSFWYLAWVSVELPKKKRWNPKPDENYWVISYAGFCPKYTWNEDLLDEKLRSFLGVYKTESEAEAMLQKIKDFVTKEIGEP